MTDFQDRGEALRQAAGIDGTAGDAQDIPHGYVRDDETGVCLLCGLTEVYRKHAGTPRVPCDCELDTTDCTDPTHAAASSGATGSTLAAGEPAAGQPSPEEVREALDGLAEEVRRFLVACAPLFQQIADSLAKAFANITDLTEALEKSHVPDRPAWQSPYGPPRKKARR